MCVCVRTRSLHPSGIIMLLDPSSLLRSSPRGTSSFTRVCVTAGHASRVRNVSHAHGHPWQGILLLVLLPWMEGTSSLASQTLSSRRQVLGSSDMGWRQRMDLPAGYAAACCHAVDFRGRPSAPHPPIGPPPLPNRRGCAGWVVAQLRRRSIEGDSVSPTRGRDDALPAGYVALIPV